MKKIVLISSISLMIPIISFSQDTLIHSAEGYITATQLKQTNLIFNEHSKLLKENKVYKSQINKYDSLCVNYKKIHEQNQNIIKEKNDSIEKLKYKLNTSKIINITSISILIGTLFALFL